MHRCGGPCTCTSTSSSSTEYHHQTNSSTFSMLFSSMPSSNYNNYDHHDVCVQDQTYYSSSSSHVDCTLSLGTPSTRLSNHQNHHHPSRTTRPAAAASCISNFCFDILHSKNTNSTPSISPLPSYKTTTSSNNSSSRTTNGIIVSNSNNTSDSLVARRCANCDTTSTPLWRNGPRGPKSLCNACGIRFKKEERRATAAASTTTTTTTTTNSYNSNGGASLMEVNTWAVHHQQQSQKMHCISSAGNDQFRFIEDDQSADNNTIPFLSWRLNVTDRPSLIHDFTR